MWAILKVDQNSLKIFEKEFKKKIGSEVLTYSPKFLIQKFKNNRLKFKEISILGNYIFCFHSHFKNSSFINKIKYLKGFKSFLPGNIENQKDINKFISRCKEFENSSGYIQSNFFKLDLKNDYKILTGVFTNKIFEIMKFQKNKIEIMIGNLKVSAKKKNLLVQPV